MFKVGDSVIFKDNAFRIIKKLHPEIANIPRRITHTTNDHFNEYVLENFTILSGVPEWWIKKHTTSNYNAPLSGFILKRG